mgnify:CR=1 FL=1
MDLDGSRLGVLRTSQRSWFEIKTQKDSGTSFVDHLGLEIMAKLFWGEKQKDKNPKMDLSNWDRMFGLPQSGWRGFGRIYHMRHGKTKDGSKQKSSSKILRVSLLKERKKFQEMFWRMETQKKGF